MLDLVTLAAERQVGVVAPPTPSSMPADERSRRMTNHPQPAGVTVIDG
jgi:hypothetical protein